MSDAVGSYYSPLVAATFMLNMQLGSGVLLLPAAFAQAGLGLASIFLGLVCFTAFTSGSWIVEAMAIANHRRRVLESRNEPGPGESSNSLDEPMLRRVDDDNDSVDSYAKNIVPEGDTFSLTHRVELGALAQTFFPLWAQIVTYACFVIYTLGTLSAYALTVTNTTLQLAHPDGYDEWTLLGAVAGAD